MKKTNLKKLVQVKEDLLKLKTLVSEMAEQEQEAFDCKSERWQESDAGCEAEEQCNLLADAADGLEQAYDALEELL